MSTNFYFLSEVQVEGRVKLLTLRWRLDYPQIYLSSFLIWSSVIRGNLKLVAFRTGTSRPTLEKGQ